MRHLALFLLLLTIHPPPAAAGPAADQVVEYILAKNKEAVTGYYRKIGRNYRPITMERAMKYAGWFRKACDNFNMDLDVHLPQGSWESGFVSCEGEEPPARRSWGLMRLQVGTANDAARKLMKRYPDVAAAIDLTPSRMPLIHQDLLSDPRLNIYLGVFQMLCLLQEHRGDMDYALAAYNAGSRGMMEKGLGFEYVAHVWREVDWWREYKQGKGKARP